MISTGGNIIALTTLLSGVHVHFLNQHRDINVTIAAGREEYSEGIQLTSDKCKYRLSVSLSVELLHVGVWDEDGVRVHDIHCAGVVPEARRSLRDEVIKILKGETVFE